MTDTQEALRQVSEALRDEALFDPGASTADTYNACKAFGTACSPENIADILAHVEAQEAEIERLRAVVSALAFQANRDPFTTIGHWCEHGPCAAIIRDVSNPYADHHGPDWTQRDSEYLK